MQYLQDMKKALSWHQSMLTYFLRESWNELIFCFLLNWLSRAQQIYWHKAWSRQLLYFYWCLACIMFRMFTVIIIFANWNYTRNTTETDGNVFWSQTIVLDNLKCWPNGGAWGYYNSSQWRQWTGIAIRRSMKQARLKTTKIRLRWLFLFGFKTEILVVYLLQCWGAFCGHFWVASSMSCTAEL